jgi:hypothetical protein
MIVCSLKSSLILCASTKPEQIYGLIDWADAASLGHDGEQYFLVIVDKGTEHVVTYNTQTRSDPVDFLPDYITITKRVPKVLRVDGAKEFVGAKMRPFAIFIILLCKSLQVILTRCKPASKVLLVLSRKFTFFPEGGAEVSEVCEVHVRCTWRSRWWSPGRGPPSNFRPKICEKVPCTRPVSSPQHRFCTTCFKTVKKSEQEEAETVILVQMLQLKFAVRETARTRSNVLRMLSDGVMQQKHMRAR